MKTAIFTSNEICDSTKAWEFFKKSLNINEKQFKILDKKYILPAKKGKLKRKQFIQALSKELKISRDKLLKIFIKGGKLIKINKKVLRKAMKLKKEGYKVIITGNTTDLFASLSVEKKLYKLFSKAILSYKVGALKNTPKFKKVLRRLK